MHHHQGGGLAGEVQLEGASLVLGPGLVGHRGAGLVVPADDRLVVVPQDGHLAAQPGEVGDRGEQVPALVVEVPVEPGHLVVLAVGVVVAVVRAPDLVAGGDHRDAGRQQQRAEEVAHRPAPGELHDGVVGRALDAVVPRAVVVVAVAVVLAVGLVVLVVVDDEVGGGETVVRGDEADRRQGGAFAEEVAAADEPGGDLAHARAAHLAPRERPGVGEPEVTGRVAEAVVPLRPGPRELPRAPAVGPEVPRLGDVQHPREHGVLAQRDEEGVVRLVAEVVTAAERDGQVVAEAVDVDLVDPVAQRVEHHLEDDRVGEVERVAAAGDVDVVPLLVEPVPRAAAETAPREGRPADALLGGVVVDDVEQDLDAGGVEQLDHALELAQHLVRVGVARVGRVRGEEAQRVVAPVVGQAEVDEVRLVGEGVHRQQLDGRHAEGAQVLDGHRVAQAGVGAAQVLGDPWQPSRHLAHVHLVDHPCVAGVGRGSVVAPVEGRVEHDIARDEGGRLAAPLEDRRVVRHGPLDGSTPRVEEQLCWVEAVPHGRVPGSVGPQPVAPARVDVRHEPTPPPVAEGGQLDARLAPFVVGQAEPHRRRAGGVDRHRHPAVDGVDARGGPVGQDPGGGGRHGSQGKQWVAWRP